MADLTAPEGFAYGVSAALIAVALTENTSAFITAAIAIGLVVTVVWWAVTA